MQFYQALAIFNKKPSLIVCCSKLNVLLENGVKDKQGHYEGVYTFQGYINERDSWIDAEGENAIWYIPDWKDWAIGEVDRMGTKYRHMRTTNDLEAICPNNEGYVLSWDYRDSNSYFVNTWISTNDVYIKCANENDFCTYDNPCESNEGDCDSNDECKDGLFCGSKNCQTQPSMDCCESQGNKLFTTCSFPFQFR